LLSSPFDDLSVIEISFLLLTSGALFTFAQIVMRLIVTDIWFWLFCGFLIIVSCLSAILLPPLAIFFVITTYSAIYIGNLQRGHLADGKKRIPDFVAPIILIGALLFEQMRDPAIFWGLYIYLGLHVLWVAGNAFWTLRGFWVWKNPVK